MNSGGLRRPPGHRHVPAGFRRAYPESLGSRTTGETLPSAATAMHYRMPKDLGGDGKSAAAGTAVSSAL